MTKEDVDSNENEQLKKDLECSLEGHAVYTNRFTCTLGGVVRLAFMEQHERDGNPKFRTAVAMHHQDAIELNKLLQRMLKDVEADLEKVMAEHKEKTK